MAKQYKSYDEEFKKTLVSLYEGFFKNKSYNLTK